MLKKEHIICKIASPRIKALHIAESDPEFSLMANGLVNIYQSALDSHLSRNELDEVTKNFINASPDEKICAGINKLLLDRCEFSPVQELDYPQLRRKLFLDAAEKLKNGELPEPSEIQGDIYGDLPGFEKLFSMRQINCNEIRDLFNIAQNQALLIYAEELKLELADPDVTALRRVMKAIKFFRLLADFSYGKNKKVNISISGPYSLFGPSAKYAVSLASLLPAVVNISQWKLEAVINFRDRKLILKLNEKSGLHSPQRSFSSYVPEEIRLYHRLFAEKSEIWQIVGDTPFLDAGEQQIIFPDLSFCENTSGQIIHLELFHRWHASQLARRLELLQNCPELPLIIGIDRALTDEDGLLEMCRGDEMLKKRCWLFRDFPGVENTLRALKKMQS